ncbi:MAG TPA: glycosyltransferase 87 family protein [Candidatus Acidoferrales bacterium]|nr:glycosyltransferase 87 family protein [Candidatus Acidoferrales bacterium]
MSSRLWWALGVIVFVLSIPAAYAVAHALPAGYDFRAYWLAARHLVDGAPVYESVGAQLGQPDEFHYLPLVAVPFILTLPLSIGDANVVWTALQLALAAAFGYVLIRPLPFAARPWAAAAYVFFLPTVLEVTLGNVDLICIVLALLAWHLRTRGNAAVVPYAAALGIKFLPLSLLPFYVAAGYTKIVVRAFIAGLVALVVTTPFLAAPMAEYVALLPRYLDTTWVRIHADREEPAWLATIAWSDWFPIVLALAALTLAWLFGRSARRDRERETDWHHIALTLSPYVTPFGFVWTTYLIASLPLFAVTFARALRLQGMPRVLALAGLFASWLGMQAVQVHELWPLVAHAAGMIGVMVIALVLLSRESRQALGRSMPEVRATSTASG